MSEPVGSPRHYRDLALFRRVLREASPYRSHLVVLFLVSLLATPVALLTPVPLKIVVDALGGEDGVPGALDAVLPGAVTASDTGVVVVAVSLLILVAILHQVQQLVVSLLQTYTGEKLVMRFRTRLFSHMQRLSLGYHDTTGTADSTYRIQYDATAIRLIAVDGLIPLVSSLVTVAGMILVTAAIDPWLALIALAVSPPLLLITHVYRRRLRRRYREVKQLESAAMSVVQEVLAALRVVKSFGQEDREEKRFVGRSAQGVRARIGVALADGALGLLVGLTIALGMGAVLAVGFHDVRAGTLSTGELVLIMGYLTQLYAPLRTLSRRAGSLQSAFASAERAFSLLDHARDVDERPEARPVERAHGAIEFRNVCFSYDGQEQVLDGMTFSVEPGTRVGIAGATGAGKSTLLSLLTRFYDPTSGQILLDGIDLRDYRIADLRDQFAIVLQDTVLFSTSIAENIAYARPDAPFEDVVQAARAANAHDFITELPNGYETLVGERGMRLSGGERQRISLARAFLKDASILLLDEATSSVDLETEALIMDAMERLMRDRTTFMIAHRPSALEGCDLRLELEKGRLVRRDALAADASGAHARPEADEPVLRAWRRMAPKLPPAVRAEVLKAPKASRPSGVYRLIDRRGGALAVAKRGSAPGLAVERALYERVLPALPVSAPRFVGYVEMGEEAWLFIEDAGDERYSPDDLALAAEWLAVLHASGARLVRDAGLPDRGPAHYRRHLEAARTTMEANRANRWLTDPDRVLVGEAIAMCARIDAQWHRLERVCARFPRTLVHGDFVEKNMRVWRRRGSTELLALDWETAGWADPAADLWQLAGSPLLEHYCDVARAHGYDVDYDHAGDLAAVGVVFRWVAGLDWASQHLAYPWVERALGDIDFYVRRLDAALPTAVKQVVTSEVPTGLMTRRSRS